MELRSAFNKFVAKELAKLHESTFMLEGKIHKTDFFSSIETILPVLKIKFIQNFNLSIFDVSYEDMFEDGDPELIISRLDEQELYYDLVNKGYFKEYSMFVYPSELTKFKVMVTKFNKYSSKFVKYRNEGLAKTIYVFVDTLTPKVDVYRLSQSVASSSKNVKILGVYEESITVEHLITQINTSKVFPICLMCEGYIESFLDQSPLKYNNVCPECSTVLENIPLVRPSDRKEFLKDFLLLSTGLYLQENDYLQDCLVSSWNE